MAGYVEREKVLSKAAPVEGCFSDMISAYDVIMLPAADVAPVRHGRWVHTDYAIHWTAKDECNECTYHASDRDDLSHYNYCPNYGAKMDGGAD